MGLMLPVTASSSLRRRPKTPHRYRPPDARDTDGCGLRGRGESSPGGDVRRRRVRFARSGTKPSRRGQNLPSGDKTFPAGTIDAVGCGNPVPAGVGCPWPGRTVPGRAECPRPGPVSARGGPGRPVSAGVGRRRGARSRPALIGMTSTGRLAGLRRRGCGEVSSAQISRRRSPRRPADPGSSGPRRRR